MFTTDFTSSSPAHGMMMTGPAPAAYNTLDKQNVVVPKNMTFSVQNGKKVSATFPAYSVTVMTFNVKKWW
jgi:alpha-L-arabinofuranosidase